MENTHQSQNPVNQEVIDIHPEKKISSLPMLLSGVVLVSAIIAGGVGYYVGSVQSSEELN